MESLVDRFGPGGVSIAECVQPTDGLPPVGPSWAAAYQAQVDAVAVVEFDQTTELETT